MEPSTATQPSSKPAPWASLMHRVSLATMGLARPLAGRRIFPLWAVLEHRGRTTGTVRRTPVVALRAEGGFIIPMPFGPSTQWTQNVLAVGGARLTWKGRATGGSATPLLDRVRGCRQGAGRAGCARSRGGPASTPTCAVRDA